MPPHSRHGVKITETVKVMYVIEGFTVIRHLRVNGRADKIRFKVPVVSCGNGRGRSLLKEGFIACSTLRRSRSLVTAADIWLADAGLRSVGHPHFTAHSQTSLATWGSLEWNFTSCLVDIILNVPMYSHLFS